MMVIYHNISAVYRKRSGWFDEPGITSIICIYTPDAYDLEPIASVFP